MIVFYDVFKALCDAKGLSPKRAVLEMGLSNSLATRWKKTGSTPNGDTLNKVAEYFGVSVDYLLGVKKEPLQQEKQEITFDDFSYAMFEETKHLPIEKKQVLLEMARFMKADLEKDKR